MESKNGDNTNLRNHQQHVNPTKHWGSNSTWFSTPPLKYHILVQQKVTDQKK
jgi:hypothetical protein